MNKLAGKFFILIVVVSILALTGCGGSMPDAAEDSTNSSAVSDIPTTSSNTGGASNMEVVEFDPVEIADDGVLIPRTPSIKQNILKPVNKKPAEEVFEEQERQGFRVQIFSSSANSGARKIEEKASGQFSDKVYLTYDPPTYKVRVGDCLAREEANIILQKAKTLGYRDAWVVRDKVIVRVKVE